MICKLQNEQEHGTGNPANQIEEVTKWEVSVELIG